MKEVTEIFTLVNEFFKGNDEKVKAWFETTNPMLGDVSPMSMIMWGRSEKLLAFVKNCIDGNKK